MLPLCSRDLHASMPFVCLVVVTLQEAMLFAVIL